MNRRKFCIGTGASLLAVHAGCGSNSSSPSPDLANSNGTDLAGVPDNCSGSVAGGAASAIIVGHASFLSSDEIFVCRDANGLFALTSVCTHQGCDVAFVSASSGFHCPCHGARFSFDGKVTLGPANAPLDNYKVCVDASGNVSVDPNTTVPVGTRIVG